MVGFGAKRWQQENIGLKIHFCMGFFCGHTTGESLSKSQVVFTLQILKSFLQKPY